MKILKIENVKIQKKFYVHIDNDLILYSLTFALFVIVSFVCVASVELQLMEMHLGLFEIKALFTFTFSFGFCLLLFLTLISPWLGIGWWVFEWLMSALFCIVSSDCS